MRSICIFLGSESGTSPAYALATEAMGRELAKRGITCVYGGSDTGLMKLLADSVLEAGGKGVGVTVTALKNKEIFHPGLTDLHVVSTMHERKKLMAELFEVDVRTVSEHLGNIYDQGELVREATVRKFRIVRMEGKREVSRLRPHV